MKKLLLASAVAALFATTVQAAPIVYGKAFLTADYIDSDLDWTDAFIASDNVKIAEKNIDRRATGKDELPLRVDLNESTLALNSNGSRIGFKGAEAITNNTEVTYQLEYGADIDGDNSKTLTRRTTYLGVKNNSFGELRFGNLITPLDNINNVTVTKGYWDNLGSSNIEPTLAEAFTMTDAARKSNTVSWSAPKIEGIPLQLDAMFMTEEENGDEGFGASLMFDQGAGFTAGIAYERDLSILGDVIRGSLSYDASKLASVPLTVGALYQKADFDNTNKDEKGFVVSAELGLANFNKPTSVYAQYNNVSDLAGIAGLDSDQFVVGGKYMYKPNMIGHAYAGYNKSENKNGESKLLGIGGGLEYLF